jgi:hypothetical protein
MNKQTVQIIDGKRYNVQTATEIASYWNGLGASDFHNVSETLYRTPKGAYFLIGSGGALSKYAQSCGNNSTSGGTRWSVLTDDEAFEWLEAHKETERLEELFPDKIQDA